jgi:nickel transport protein
MMKKTCLAFAVAVCAIPQTVAAHDVWLTISRAEDGCRAIVNYGHPNDRPPALADKIVDFAALTGKERVDLIGGLIQKQTPAAIIVESRVFNDCGHSLAAVSYDNGFWVKAPSGSHRNATVRSVPDAQDSLWSVKFAKAITGPGAPWGTVMGTLFEVVPLSDPAAAKPGDSLRVRVLFQGKPLAGIAVERTDGVSPVKEDDIPRFMTDSDGVASVPIVGTGLHLLAIDYKVSPSATPSLAKMDLYNTTLTFTVGQEN